MKIRFKRFFSTDSTKAIKAGQYGYLNGINYMSPANTAGLGNLCSHHTAGCLAPCLGLWSGQAAMRRDGEDNAVTLSRKAKAHYFMTERQAFMNEAAHHIAALVRSAERLGLKPCVRLNGSTDIAFERMLYLPYDGRKPTTLIAQFPHVQFVDYTKNPGRFSKPLPANYSLTFSRSESNEAQAIDLLNRGHNVAAVFADALPQALWGFDVIDGDKHDLRHLDPHGVVVGLTPKGYRINRDTTGFLIRAAA